MAASRRVPRPLFVIATLTLCIAPVFPGDGVFAGNIHRAIVTRVAPVYPELARHMHIVGKVVLLVAIQADGTVSSVRVESGHALLTAAAEDAVRRWHFAPNSEATESEIEVHFDVSGQ